MHQMKDFDGKRFMIKVRLLAAWKNLVHDNWVAKFDVTVRQRPQVFSENLNLISEKYERI